MAHFTNFSFEFVYKIFTEDASQPRLYYGAESQKWPKTQIKGGVLLKSIICVKRSLNAKPKESFICVKLSRVLFVLNSPYATLWKDFETSKKSSLEKEKSEDCNKGSATERA